MYRFLDFLETYRLKHRNSQKRIYIRNACYFVTIKTHNNFPYFRERIFCDLFVENLRLCKRLKQFHLYGWVLIYDHFHLMVQPNDDFDISNVIQFLKRHVTRNINVIMDYVHDKTNEGGIGHRISPCEGGIGQSRLQVFGILRHNNHWLYIEIFDQCVQKLKSQSQQKYQNQNPFPKFQWQESFHDHYIRNQRDFDHHMKYIVYNPEKHHMPDNWTYVFTNGKYNTLTDEFI